MINDKTKEYIRFFLMCFLVFFGMISSACTISYSAGGEKLYLFSGLVGLCLMVYLLVISFKRFWNNTK